MSRLVKTCWVFCLMFLVSQLQANDIPTSTVNFYEGSLNDAKKKARHEGKLFLVDFYANWCSPCKWMDNTTFKDPNVVAALNRDFVSIKVDVDKFEGYELKEKYKVRYLPTILVFNEQGELIERMEETMSPSKMMTMLNKLRGGARNNSVMEINAAPTKLVNQVVEQKTSAGTKHFGKYRIQVAVYSDFKNTFERVNELKETFAEPIIVMNDIQNEEIVYKVMLGEFDTADLAEDFVNILANQFNIQGKVK